MSRTPRAARIGGVGGTRGVYGPAVARRRWGPKNVGQVVGERFVVQVPQIVVRRRGPERAHSSWVSEDRRSRAARWGAWAAKIRRLLDRRSRGAAACARRRGGAASVRSRACRGWRR